LCFQKIVKVFFFFLRFLKQMEEEEANMICFSL
jgi:hypothetical protein